jgi:hypothetical protein
MVAGCALIRQNCQDPKETLGAVFRGCRFFEITIGRRGYPGRATEDVDVRLKIFSGGSPSAAEDMVNDWLSTAGEIRVVRTQLAIYGYDPCVVITVWYEGVGSPTAAARGFLADGREAG